MSELLARSKGVEMTLTAMVWFLTGVVWVGTGLVWWLLRPAKFGRMKPWAYIARTLMTTECVVWTLFSIMLSAGNPSRTDPFWVTALMVMFFAVVLMWCPIVASGVGSYRGLAVGLGLLMLSMSRLVSNIWYGLEPSVLFMPADVLIWLVLAGVWNSALCGHHVTRWWRRNRTKP